VPDWTTVFGRKPHFHALRVPVRVEVWFFVITVLMAINRTYLPFSYVFEWIAVVFVSILVHELGHAMAFRRLGQEPQVLLTGMGGLTYGSAPFSSRSADIITSLAGPVAGILFLGIPAWLIDQQLDVTDPRLLRVVIYDLFWVSFIWSFVNLVPVLPLDGGHVSQALFGRTTARKISIAAALVMVWFLIATGYRYGIFFFLILGGLSAYELWAERKAGMAPRVAVLPPSPGEYGGGYGGGDYGAPPTRPGRGPKPAKPAKPMSARQAKKRAHLQVVPDTLEDLSRVEGPVPVGLEQVETVGWRAVRDGDVQVARRALAKVPPGRSVDPFLTPSVDLLDGDVDDAVAGFVAAYTTKAEGPSSLLPATLLGKYGQGVEVARRLLEVPGAAPAFAVGGLQGHLHYAGYYVASANVGELLHDDARANRAQVAFEVACAWSRADRSDLALAWVGRAIDDGFTAGSVLDTESDLEATRSEPGWPSLRARLG
jgi:stage IV sporulation protein FB